MRLDHLSYAAGPEGLAECVQRIGAKLGAAFVDGGLHPAFGTRNFVLPLTDSCYLEVVGVLDHPAVYGAPFGRAVRARAAAGGGWLAWAVRVEELTVIEARLGRSAANGHRRRPDGVELRWKEIGMDDLAVDPQRPFFVHWLSGQQYHPSAGSSAVSVTRLEIAGDGRLVGEYLDTSSDQTLEGVEVEWQDPWDDAGIVAAVFETRYGPVRID